MAPIADMPAATPTPTPTPTPIPTWSWDPWFREEVDVGSALVVEMFREGEGWFVVVEWAATGATEEDRVIDVGTAVAVVTTVAAPR